MRLLKPFAGGLVALSLLMGGAYAVAQSAAETAVAEAIARLRTALGPGAVVEHGAIRAEPIAGRVRVASLTIMPDGPGGERFVVTDVVADRVRPGGTGFERLSLHGTRILVGEEERGRIGSVTIEGLTLPAGSGFSLDDITLDSLDVLDLAWTLPDGSGLHLSYLSASGIGDDRSESYEILDLVVVGGRDSGFELLEIGGFEIAGARLLEMALAGIEGRAPPAPRGQSNATLRDLLVRVDGLDVVRLGSATSDSDDVEGQPGTQRTELSLRDLVIGLPQDARDALGGLEALRLTITGEGTTNQERGDTHVESFRIEAEELGTLELAARVTGAPLPPAGDPMANGRLHGFSLSFEDAGLTARVLAGAARLSARPEADLRAEVRQALGEIEALLGDLGAPPQAAAPEPKPGSEAPLPNSKLGPQGGAAPAPGRPLRAFLDRPGRITITAQPPRPVTFTELERQDPAAGPEALFRLLGLRVQVQ